MLRAIISANPKPSNLLRGAGHNPPALLENDLLCYGPPGVLVPFRFLRETSAIVFQPTRKHSLVITESYGV